MARHNFQGFQNLKDFLIKENITYWQSYPNRIYLVTPKNELFIVSVRTERDVFDGYKQYKTFNIVSSYEEYAKEFNTLQDLLDYLGITEPPIVETPTNNTLLQNFKQKLEEGGNTCFWINPKTIGVYFDLETTFVESIGEGSTVRLTRKGAKTRDCDIKELRTSLWGTIEPKTFNIEDIIKVEIIEKWKTLEVFKFQSKKGLELTMTCFNNKVIEISGEVSVGGDIIEPLLFYNRGGKYYELITAETKSFYLIGKNFLFKS